MIINVENVAKSDLLERDYAEAIGLNVANEWYQYFNNIDVEAVNIQLLRLRSDQAVIINIPNEKCLNNIDNTAIYNFFNAKGGVDVETNYNAVKTWFRTIASLLTGAECEFEIDANDANHYTELFKTGDKIVMNEVIFAVAHSMALGTFMTYDELKEILDTIPKDDRYQDFLDVINAQLVPDTVKNRIIRHLIKPVNANDAETMQPNVAPSVTDDDNVDDAVNKPKNCIKFENIIPDEKKKPSKKK